MSRIPQLDATALTSDQQEVYDAIVHGPRGAVVGPLRVWLQSPGLAPTHLSELAILVTARYWSSGFEWSHHVPIALEAGVPKHAVYAIGQAKRFNFEDARMQAVFNFVVELHLLKKVSDASYAAAKHLLGLRGCVDLVGICGYYTLISMTINVFDVADGSGPTLPKLEVGIGNYFKI